MLVIMTLSKNSSFSKEHFGCQSTSRNLEVIMHFYFFSGTGTNWKKNCAQRQGREGF